MAGDAYMGKPGAMEKLMQFNPKVGMQIQQQKQVAEQQKIAKAAKTDKALKAMLATKREVFSSEVEKAAKLGTPEEFVSHLENFRESLRPEFGDVVDSIPAPTAEMYEQAKQMHGGDPKSKYSSIKKGIGPDGKEVFMGLNKETGKMEPIEGGVPTPGKGMKITTADGTTIETGVSTGGLTKSNQTKVQKDLLGATDALLKVNDIAAGFKPEYQELTTKFKMFGKNIKSILGGDTSPEDEAEMTAFSDYRADSGRLLTETLKEMSGAAVTESEAKRAETYIPKAGVGLFDGDSPVQMKAKIKNFQRFQIRATARLNFIRKNGMEIGDIPLDRMEAIMERRGEAIEEELAGKGAPEDKIESLTRQQLAKEFGLIQ